MTHPPHVFYISDSYYFFVRISAAVDLISAGPAYPDYFTRLEKRNHDDANTTVLNATIARISR